MRLLPVQKNSVLLFSYYGEQYSGSPKYISKYLSENSDFDIIWAFVSGEEHRSYDGKFVKYGHLSYYYCLATCGVIITNYRMTEEFKKRSNQKYIQTWHSSLRLKMIENDAAQSLPDNYVKMAKKDSKQIDYLLAGSRKSREIFEQSFWYDGAIINTGTPQCDILVDDCSDYVEKVFDYYNIPKDAHIALYAPTFRKNHDTSVYNLNTSALINTLKEKFGGRWYLLIRLHPHLIGKVDCLKYSENVIQATDYDDVQELLCATDVLISDYSAIMFDYAVTRRPCFLYVPDIEVYTSSDRNLYFDIKKLPFKSSENQNELFDSIMDYSSKEYEKDLNKFLEEIGSYDDGQASKRVYEIIRGNL